MLPGRAGLVGDTPQRFRPVLLDYGDDTAGIVFVIEEIDDERVAVLEPWVPTPMAGNMKIVPRSRIRELDAGFGEVTAVFSAVTRPILVNTPRNASLSCLLTDRLIAIRFS